MAHQIFERPNAYCLSKNQIRYAYTIDELDRSGLYFEYKLLYRILTGQSKVNWQMSKTTYDFTLQIFVNGVLALDQSFTGVGNLTIKGGDLVKIILPTLTPWPAGDPYIKLRVFTDQAEVYNQYTADQDEPHWLTYEFTAAADTIYTVKAYTADEGTLTHDHNQLVVTESKFNELAATKLKPNPDGTVYILLKQIIDSLLKMKHPDGAITNASQQAMYFYIQVREVWEDNTAENFTTTERLHVRLVIKAGVENHQYSRNNFFVNYFDTEKPWMTWQPAGRMVYPDQPFFLTAFVKSGTLKGCILRVTKRTVAGVQTVADTELDLGGFIFHFNVSAAALGIPAAELYWHEISIVKDDENLIDPYRVYSCRDMLYKWNDIIYSNSLGGWDTVRTAGETKYGIDRVIEEAEGGYSVDEWSALIKSHEAKHTVITQRRSNKGDIGYIRTREEQEVFVELLRSTMIYVRIFTRYVPILVTQKQQALNGSNDKLLNFPFDWSFSETNESFTPSYIDLGTGSDTEIY